MLLARSSIWSVKNKDRIGPRSGISRANPEARDAYVHRIGGHYRRGKDSSGRPYSHPNNRMRLVTSLSGVHGVRVRTIALVKAAPWFADILEAELDRYEAPRAAVLRYWIGMALLAQGRITSDELRALEVPAPLPVGQVAPGWAAKRARATAS